MRKIIIEVPEFCSDMTKLNQDNACCKFKERAVYCRVFNKDCSIDIHRNAVIPCKECKKAEVKK